jgi:pimeloyl-ACP methyl ester carboxylesterase
MMALQMSWTRCGRGEERLVLLHGVGSTREDFAAIRPLLDEHFDVLSPDLPGHGRSAKLLALPTVSALADALEADLDELGVGRVHVLGNSLGGRLALELAVRGRALSVVALSPCGMSLPVERMLQGLVMTTRRLVLRSLRGEIAPSARSTLGRSLLSAGMRSAPWRTSEAEAHAVAGGFAAAEDFWSTLWWAVLGDVPRDLHKIDVPVMLVEGTADVISGGQTARYLTSVPGATFVPLPGAGHAPHSDAPHAIVRLVRRAAAAATARVSPE